jgi:ABC-type glycerol-3-phosphate transport system substrate-binding protein
MFSDGMSLSDIAAVTKDNDSMGGMGAWWIIIFVLFFAFGGGGFGNNAGGNALTQQEMQAGFNNQTVVGKLDRLGDGISSLGYDQLGQMNALQRDLCTGFANGVAATNAAAAQAQQCCCETQKEIMQSRFNSAQETCEIIQSQNNNTQKILDAITTNRMADMQNQINQLQLQSALCGVVRYPSATTYSAGYNPYFGSNGCGCA